MKKIILVSVMLLAVVFSAFSANTSLGVAQNYINTSVIVDTDIGGRFGFEGSVGFPVVSALFGAIDSISEGEEFKPLQFVLPGAMVNTYWKAVDGNKFQLRLGLQADVLVFLEKRSVQAAGLLGTSLGLNYKFNGKFAINFTAGCPLALPLSLISNDAASWTLFYFSSTAVDKSDILKIIFGGIGCAMNQFARISFKWNLN